MNAKNQPVVAFGCFLLVIATLLTLCSCNKSSLPSQVDRIPTGLANGALQLSGIHKDGWMAPTASLVLAQPAGKALLTVRAMVPDIGNAGFGSEVELRVDGKTLARQSVRTGEFRISARVAEGVGGRHITVVFGSTQELPGGDGRSVGARLIFVGFEKQGAESTPVTSDIVRGNGVQLGNGWGVLENFRNETFRWVANDAQVRVDTVPGGQVELSLLIEAGPGLGTTTFRLKALSASGQEVASAQVEGRSNVKLLIPVEGGKPAEFRLHVDGGGKAAPNDPRILNFRVFQISASASNGPRR